MHTAKTGLLRCCLYRNWSVERSTKTSQLQVQARRAQLLSLWPRRPATPLQTTKLHVRSGTHPTRSFRPSWPTRGSLLCPRTLVAFPKPFWSTSILLVGACTLFNTVVIAPGSSARPCAVFCCPRN